LLPDRLAATLPGDPVRPGGRALRALRPTAWAACGPPRRWPLVGRGGCVLAGRKRAARTPHARIRGHPRARAPDLRGAYSDEAGRGFRFEAGRHSEAKPATGPI